MPSSQGPGTAPSPISPPSTPSPPTIKHVSSQRLTALFEVLLCSGFPTQLILGITLTTIGLSATDQSGQLLLPYVVALSMGDTIILLGLIFYFLYLHAESPRDFFLGHRVPRREIKLGLLLTPVMVIVTIVSLSTIHVLWPSLRNVPENPLANLLQSPIQTFIFIAVAISAGGIREELQRAFVLRRFEQHLGGGWLGLVVFSVAFGLGHYIQGWDAVIVTAALGAIWGAIYLIRRSVMSAVVSHAGFNTAEILIALLATAPNLTNG